MPFLVYINLLNLCFGIKVSNLNAVVLGELGEIVEDSRSIIHSLHAAIGITNELSK